MALLAFLVTVAFAPVWPDGAAAPRWALLSIVIPALLLVTPRVPWTAGHLLLYSFVVWCGATLIWAPVAYDGVEIFWHLCLFAAVFTVAQVRAFDVHKSYLFAALALLVNTAVVLLQFWNVLHPWVEDQKISGLFFNKNLGSETAVLVAVGLLVSYKRNYLLAFLVLIPVFLVPLSRGALLALAAGGLTALGPGRASPCSCW